MTIRSLVAKTIGICLGLEALNSASWIAGLLPSLFTRDALTLTLLVLRAGVTALQMVAAIMLFGDRPPGLSMARSVLIASALLMTFEVGWRLAPSNMDLTFRWWFISAYWLYAGLVTLAARSSR